MFLIISQLQPSVAIETKGFLTDLPENVMHLLHQEPFSHPSEI